MPNLTDFQSKVALVTGAGSGIGRATAMLFAARGASVAVVDVNAETGVRTADEIGARGGHALFLHADLTSEQAVAGAVERTLSHFAGLHCACNCAGILFPVGPFHTLPLEHWNELIAVDLTAVFLCMKHDLAHMVRAGGGAIVNTSSAAGVVPATGQPHYTAAKHGVLGLTKAAADRKSVV